MQQWVEDNLDSLIEVLPHPIQQPLLKHKDLSDLLEVVLDLGRLPEARFPGRELYLGSREVTDEDIQYVIALVSPFGDDNRAGIERTLHRISAIRNRKGKIVGLTCRVGRAVFGTVRVIEDLVSSGRSILLLGRPGVGKTTMLREAARVLAVDANKRVVVVDTSNEIAGDGDIPHASIGKARRMQVVTPSLQHAVMIEAVENHMPEVIIIDEMGTELEAAAARTIAERGVQLVATAHGNILDNLVMNPTLSDLVGGVQSVTLGDEEAKRRRTQKSILERKGPPTFDIVVEIQSWHQVAVHQDVAQVVDRMLRGFPITPEIRWVDEEGEVHKAQQHSSVQTPPDGAPEEQGRVTRVHSFGVNRSSLEQVIRGARLPVELVGTLQDANLLLTTKAHYRKGAQVLQAAEEQRKPVFVLRKNTVPQIEQFLRLVTRGDGTGESFPAAVEEAEQAARRVLAGERKMELLPREASIRQLQHTVAQRYQLRSQSHGSEPRRRVTIYRS